MVAMVRKPGASSTNLVDEDARDYLQKRLQTLSALMFSVFVVLLGFIYAVFTAYPEKEPYLNNYVYLISAVGMAALGLQWRLMHTRPLTLRALRTIDVIYMVGTGVVFAASGALAYNRPASAYICVTFASLLVVMRALIVPSTWPRTLVISIATCAPMTAATIFLAYAWKQDVPPPAYVGGGILICGMAILLATTGSRTLYNLGEKISDLDEKLSELEGKQLGQYTIVSKIGEGGNGEVYRATHAMLRRPAAIKLIKKDRVDEQTLDRFAREVHHMSELTHPNTVAVYDYGRTEDGVFYYVMEYLDGLDLERLVRNTGRMPVDRVVPILVQICGALAEAHARKLIHRDIKPANIILCQRGGVPDVAKVVDFGLVKEQGGQHAFELVGTPAFMAPEQANMETVSPATDLYGVAAVGYFLLTGRRVFEGGNLREVLSRVVTEEVVPPSQVVDAPIPESLEALLMRCLEKDPGKRPASADELAEMLRGVPLGKAWTEPVARTWWRELKPVTSTTTVTGTTKTITVVVPGRIMQPPRATDGKAPIEPGAGP
jgi:eukaryotic-like serine/threonine-protein kinase